MLTAFGYATAKKFGIIVEDVGNAFLFKYKQTAFATLFAVAGAVV